MAEPQREPTEIERGIVPLADLSGADHVIREAVVRRSNPTTGIPDEMIDEPPSPYAVIPVDHGRGETYMARGLVVEPGSHIEAPGSLGLHTVEKGHSTIIQAASVARSSGGLPTVIRGDDAAAGGPYPESQAVLNDLIAVPPGTGKAVVVGSDDREKDGGASLGWSQAQSAGPAEILTEFRDAFAPMRRGSGTPFSEPGIENLTTSQPVESGIGGAGGGGGGDRVLSGADAAGGSGGSGGPGGGAGGAGGAIVSAAQNFRDNAERAWQDALDAQGAAERRAQEERERQGFTSQATLDAARRARERQLEARRSLDRAEQALARAQGRGGGQGGRAQQERERQARGVAQRIADLQRELGQMRIVAEQPADLAAYNEALRRIREIEDQLQEAEDAARQIAVGFWIPGQQTTVTGVLQSRGDTAALQAPLAFVDANGQQRTAVAVRQRQDGGYELIDANGNAIPAAVNRSSEGYLYVRDTNGRATVLGNINGVVNLGLGGGIRTQALYNSDGEARGRGVVVGAQQGTRRARASIQGFNYPVGSDAYQRQVEFARADLIRIGAELAADLARAPADRMSGALRQQLEAQAQFDRDIIADADAGLPLGTTAERRSAVAVPETLGEVQTGIRLDAPFGPYHGVGYPLRFRPVSMPAANLTSVGTRWSAGYLMELGGMYTPVVPISDELPATPPADPPKPPPPPKPPDEHDCKRGPGDEREGNGRTGGGGGGGGGGGTDERWDPKGGELGPCNLGPNPHPNPGEPGGHPEPGGRPDLGSQLRTPGGSATALVSTAPGTIAARSLPSAGRSPIQPQRPPYRGFDPREAWGAGVYMRHAPAALVPPGGIRLTDALDFASEVHTRWDVFNHIIDKQNQIISWLHHLHPLAPDAINGVGLKLPTQEEDGVRLEQFDPGTIVTLRETETHAKSPIEHHVPAIVERGRNGEKRLVRLGNDARAERTIGSGVRGADIIERFDTGRPTHRNRKRRTDAQPKRGYDGAAGRFFHRGSDFAIENGNLIVVGEDGTETQVGVEAPTAHAVPRAGAGAVIRGDWLSRSDEATGADVTVASNANWSGYRRYRNLTIASGVVITVQGSLRLVVSGTLDLQGTARIDATGQSPISSSLPNKRCGATGGAGGSGGVGGSGGGGGGGGGADAVNSGAAGAAGAGVNTDAPAVAASGNEPIWDKTVATSAAAVTIDSTGGTAAAGGEPTQNGQSSTNFAGNGANGNAGGTGVSTPSWLGDLAEVPFVGVAPGGPGSSGGAGVSAGAGGAGGAGGTNGGGGPYSGGAGGPGGSSGSGGAGGAGGGLIVIECGTLTGSGSIVANGAAGSAGTGGASGTDGALGGGA